MLIKLTQKTINFTNVSFNIATSTSEQGNWEVITIEKSIPKKLRSQDGEAKMDQSSNVATAPWSLDLPDLWGDIYNINQSARKQS
jgi:hypothetical protein